jgi:hypothetical protein
LADGRVVEFAIGHAFIRVRDREEITLVLFGEPESPPLLGLLLARGTAAHRGCGDAAARADALAPSFRATARLTRPLLLILRRRAPR